MPTIRQHLETILHTSDRLGPKCALSFCGKPFHQDIEASLANREATLLNAADSFAIMRLMEKAFVDTALRVFWFKHTGDGKKDWKAFQKWHKRNFGRFPRVNKVEFDDYAEVTTEAWARFEEDVCQR